MCEGNEGKRMYLWRSIIRHLLEQTIWIEKEEYNKYLKEKLTEI
jgi:hypothetical protein